MERARILFGFRHLGFGFDSGFGFRVSDLLTVVRLQKFLADAGVASRRASEEIILAGQVSVNGETVRQLGAKVDPLHDKVTVDGQPLRARRKMYVALNKPAGVVCSRKDEFSRSSIYDLLPKEWQHLR